MLTAHADAMSSDREGGRAAVGSLGRRRAKGLLLHSRAGLALLFAVSLLLPTQSSPVIGSTEAAWQRDHVSTGAFGAVTIPAPRLTAPCRFLPGVLTVIGPRIEIYWAPPPTYGDDKAQVWASTAGLGTALAPLTGFNLRQNTAFDARAGHYVTTVPTNLLGGLLGLGTEIELSIVIAEHGWTSTPASTATNAGLVLGLGATCRNLS
ncbi:hypothetical protein AC792_04005 [Arthrobacter sp. RIT-PI-e]|nr:hypothetical protein AC792_04005 [Arthrobacter sp. RIT-PI-e]